MQIYTIFYPGSSKLACFNIKHQSLLAACTHNLGGNININDATTKIGRSVRLVVANAIKSCQPA